MSKILQNINVLDVTAASEQSLEGVSKIENVNMLLYSKATSSLLAKITLENVNIQAEVPENCVLSQVNGRYEVGDSLSGEKPLFIIVNGVLLFPPETASEDVEKRVGGILVNGTIYCPQSLKGVVQQKIIHHNGRFVTYMEATNLFVDGVRLDNAFLHTLQPLSRISFGGKVVMLDDLDSSLLDEKLDKVEFTDKLIIREDLLASISGKIINAHRSKCVTVPTGTYYTDGNLKLNKSALRRLKNRRIHAAGVLHFESDVAPGDIGNFVDSLHSESLIICPEGLENAVLDKTADPTVEILAYTGKLRVIEGEYTLSASELKYSNQPLSYIIHGVMNIATDIDADLFFDSLGFIVNEGIISGSGEHCGIVQLKMLKNSGIVTDIDNEEENDSFNRLLNEDDIYVRNTNFLKL